MCQQPVLLLRFSGGQGARPTAEQMKSGVGLKVEIHAGIKLKTKRCGDVLGVPPSPPAVTADALHCHFSLLRARWTRLHPSFHASLHASNSSTFHLQSASSERLQCRTQTIARDSSRTKLQPFDLSQHAPVLLFPYRCTWALVSLPPVQLLKVEA